MGRKATQLVQNVQQLCVFAHNISHRVALHGMVHLTGDETPLAAQGDRRTLPIALSIYVQPSSILAAKHK